MRKLNLNWSVEKRLLVVRSASVASALDQQERHNTVGFFSTAFIAGRSQCCYGDPGHPGRSAYILSAPHPLTAGHTTSPGTQLQPIRAAGACLHQIWTCLNRQHHGAPVQLSRWSWLIFRCMRKSGASHETCLQSRAPSWDCCHTHSSQNYITFFFKF